MLEDARRLCAGRAIYLLAEEVAASPEEGYDRVVVELDRALRRQVDVSLYIARPRTIQNSRLSPALRRLRIYRLRALLQVASSARRGGEDLQIIYASRSSMTLAALIRVTLLRLLSGRQVTLLALQPWPSRRALGRLARLMAPDRLLVLTAEQAERAWRLGIPAAVFPTGVDADRFRPASATERRQLRRKWEIDESARVVLHVGHLSGGRNLEALIPLTRLPQTVVLVVCSSQRDGESERIRRALEAAGVLVLASYMPHIEELYRLADCYVFPTLSSGHAIGFPLSILEAMACDLPVATTRFGAIPDYLAAAPAVRLVDDPAQLPSAVEDLLGTAASARPLAAEFSWDRAAAAILAG